MKWGGGKKALSRAITSLNWTENKSESMDPGKIFLLPPEIDLFE